MTDLITPKRGEELIDKNGQPTLRFITWIEDLTGTANDSNDSVLGISSFSTQSQWLQQQINGLPEFTIDTTGFTTDTTLITTDKVIA